MRRGWISWALRTTLASEASHRPLRRKEKEGVEYPNRNERKGLASPRPESTERRIPKNLGERKRQSAWRAGDSFEGREKRLTSDGHHEIVHVDDAGHGGCVPVVDVAEGARLVEEARVRKGTGDVTRARCGKKGEPRCVCGAYLKEMWLEFHLLLSLRDASGR